MSSLRPKADASPEPEWNSDGKAASPAPSGELTSLFEEVLQKTSHSLISQEHLTDAEKQAFDDVARRLRGKSLPLETIVSELLFAMFENQISGLPYFNQVGRTLSLRVARTLIDDPVSKLRLETVWHKLQGDPA